MRHDCSTKGTDLGGAFHEKMLPTLISSFTVERRGDRGEYVTRSAKSGGIAFKGSRASAGIHGEQPRRTRLGTHSEGETRGYYARPAREPRLC